MIILKNDDMIEYKDIQFYNDYCASLEDFTLIEPFFEEDGTYKGKIMANESFYKLEINVFIPSTFPHNKLTFATRSISGYPHLIPYYNAPYLGSWFCLNTAFAETAEEQLNEEFDRLREWIKNQMRPELPRHITDEETSHALRTFNIYKGNNEDELNEIRETEDFIFMGDFASDPKKFEKYGHLHAIKQPNGKITVLPGRRGDYELPYVIVDHFPKNINSFASCVDEFKWDDEICKTLLPDFEWGKEVASASFSWSGKLPTTVEEIEESRAFLKSRESAMDIPPAHKERVDKEIDNYLNMYQRMLSHKFDEDDYGYDEETAANIYYYEFHYLAIGVISEGNLSWFLFLTNRNSRVYDDYSYDFERIEIVLKHVRDIRLHNFSLGKIVKREEYFGRGELHNAFVSKKVAIIGLGAIGSTLAESLIRGGLNKLTLWDGDLVEPGNICRSSYLVSDIGDAKATALANRLHKISPFSHIDYKGGWTHSADDYSGICKFSGGEFYGNINYKSQEEFVSALQGYDLIIDCTASNELLHFLSYGAKDVDVLSLCITNQSRDLLCVSNRTGNPFELRKHYLSCIEQETGNFYSEGTGCYAPTFLATHCDIQALVNLCARAMNRAFQSSGAMGSMIWHYKDDGISVQNLHTYNLENSPITLTIADDSIESIKRLPTLKDGGKGYLLGGYSSDRTAIYVTNVISKINAQEQLETIKNVSNGIINYVGDICISHHNVGEVSETVRTHIIEQSKGDNIDTDNPLVACVNEQGNVEFSLYIGGEFVPFGSAH